MSRKPEGDHALSAAERQARQRNRKATIAEQRFVALYLISQATTLREARAIALSVIDPVAYNKEKTP